MAVDLIGIMTGEPAERIELDDDAGLFAGYRGAHTQGDRLSDVTGVVSYGFENYKLLVTEAVTVTSDVTLGRETTALDGDDAFVIFPEGGNFTERRRAAGIAPAFASRSVLA